MDENKLDELIHQYMDDEIEFDVVVEFCDELESTEDNKRMLIECIDCFDVDVLYETLFRKFKAFLTPDERQIYRDRFSSTFDQALYSADYLE